MNKKAEKYLYIENKTGYSFIILFVILNGAAFLISLDHIAINSGMMWYSLFNILLTLITFLGATQQKVYAEKWAYLCLGVAVLQIVRLFVPVPVFRDTSVERINNILLILSTVAIVTGSVITIRKQKMRRVAEGLITKPVAH